MPKPLPQLLQHTPHRIIASDPTTAALAAARHDFPARKLTIVGVTGTDGKTTTTWLTHALLNADNLTAD